MEFSSEIKRYNISDLWTVKRLFWTFEGIKDSVERGEPLGYIGDNYQRFYIHFVSVIPNPSNALEYLVFGKTKVKENICSFQGTMKVTEAKVFFDKEIPILKQGFIKGEYCFYEDPNLKGSGILKGVFKTNFYIDTDSKIKYNALHIYSDGYNNNPFEGTWTSYTSGKSVKCNWGDFRIPDSDALGGGAAEFMPNDTYLKNGWENYKLLLSTDERQASEARHKEEIKWWITTE